MAIIYTYECPKCKVKLRELQIVVRRHEKCAATNGDPGPYWVLDSLHIEGVDPEPTAKRVRSQV